MKRIVGIILAVSLLLSGMSALAGNVTINMPKNFIDAEGNAMADYDVHVIDQDGHPVPGVTVSFIIENEENPDAEVEPTDTEESDEKGEADFEVSPLRYHVKITELPEGYSIPEDAPEVYTIDTSSSVILKVHKD